MQAPRFAALRRLQNRLPCGPTSQERCHGACDQERSVGPDHAARRRAERGRDRAFRARATVSRSCGWPRSTAATRTPWPARSRPVLPGMRIGTAVVPAQTRTPFVHAMAGLTLSQLTERQLHPRHRPVVAEHRAGLGRAAVRQAAHAHARIRDRAAQGAGRRARRLRGQDAAHQAPQARGRGRPAACRSISARSTSRCCG